MEPEIPGGGAGGSRTVGASASVSGRAGGGIAGVPPDGCGADGVPFEAEGAADAGMSGPGAAAVGSAEGTVGGTAADGAGVGER